MSKQQESTSGVSQPEAQQAGGGERAMLRMGGGGQAGDEAHTNTDTEGSVVVLSSSEANKRSEEPDANVGNVD